jgi:hypothetical protein
MVIKYLTISQHDDLYITLNKMNHLLIGHYVKDNVQSFNVAFLHQDASPRILPSLQKKLYFEPNTKMIFFSITFNHNNH